MRQSSTETSDEMIYLGNGEIVVPTALAVIGAYVAYQGVELGLTNLDGIAAGMFPFVAGSAMTVLALIVVTRVLLADRRDRASQDSSDSAEIAKNESLARKRLVIVVAMAVAIAATQLVGFIVAFSALIYVLAGWLEQWGQRKSILLALGTAGLVQLVFVGWLRVPLPSGALW